MHDILTLVSSNLAKVGYQFQHMGEAEKCRKSCSLYKVCIGNLRRGSIYEVIEVRDKVHPCILIDDKVNVVKVKELPIETLIDSRSAFESAIITYRQHKCSEIACSNYNTFFDRNLEK